MNSKTKANLYYYGSFFVVYIVARYIINYLFNDIDGFLLAVIAAFVAVILAPHKQTIQTQTGEQYQLKWLFSKKVIIIK